MAKQTEPVRRSYVCPSCFTTVDPNKVHYACTGTMCSRQFAQRAFSTRNIRDMNYVNKSGTAEIDWEACIHRNIDPQGPDAIVTKNHIIRSGSNICDMCNRNTYIRLCPICHNRIPIGAEEDGNQIIVILGPKGVGKSHYIGVLINQLKNYVSKEFNATLAPGNDWTMINYRSTYEQRLFDEMRKLQPTESFETGPREPLVFYFRVLDPDNPQVFTLVFFDTAGEDLVTSSKMLSLNINSFISAASGIVYLVDPLQIKYINDRINIENKPPVGPDISDVLNNISQIIRVNKKIRAKDKVDIPIAVCLTKSDVLFKAGESEEENSILFDKSSSLHIPREHGRFDQENFEQIDAELEEYIRRTVGDHFIQTVRGFKDYGFFAVSSLGCNPTGVALPRGVSPMRVEDPFIWLLHKEGLR